MLRLNRELVLRARKSARKYTKELGILFEEEENCPDPSSSPSSLAPTTETTLNMNETHVSTRSKTSDEGEVAPASTVNERRQVLIHSAVWQGRWLDCVVLSQCEWTTKQPRGDKSLSCVAWLAKRNMYEGSVSWIRPDKLRATRRKSATRETFGQFWCRTSGVLLVSSVASQLGDNVLRTEPLPRHRLSSLGDFVEWATSEALVLDVPPTSEWTSTIEKLRRATTISDARVGLCKLHSVVRSGRHAHPLRADTTERNNSNRLRWLCDLTRPLLSPAAGDESWWTASERGKSLLGAGPNGRNFDRRLVLVCEQTLGNGHPDAARTVVMAERALGVPAVYSQLANVAPSSRPRALFTNAFLHRPEQKTCGCVDKGSGATGSSAVKHNGSLKTCPRDCPLGIFACTDTTKWAALSSDNRSRARCIGKNLASHLNPDEHFGASSIEEAVSIVNALLKRRRGNKDKIVELRKIAMNIVSTCNLLPTGRDSYGPATPDQLAALLGVRLDEDGKSPTSWIRDVMPEEASVFVEQKLLGHVFSPVMLESVMCDWLDPASPAALSRGGSRPLWSFFCGIGNELATLADANVPLSKIYAADCSEYAIRTYARIAQKYYPRVPVALCGDMLDDTGVFNWSDESVRGRLDREGVPIIIAGWPCNGHAGANRNAHGTHAFDHASTAMLMILARILATVKDWMNDH